MKKKVKDNKQEAFRLKGDAQESWAKIVPKSTLLGISLLDSNVGEDLKKKEFFKSNTPNALRLAGKERETLQPTSEDNAKTGHTKHVSSPIDNYKGHKERTCQTLKNGKVISKR